MVTELKQGSLVLVESSPFRQGMNDGALRYFHADTPCRPVTEEDVIEFAQEGCLDEEQLRSNAGFLLGWIAAGQLPLSARTERSVF